MPSSVKMRSTRAISWIWKRIVSRFSNITVTMVPTCDPATPLQLDDLRAELLALAFVGTRVGDVGEGELAVDSRWSRAFAFLGDAVGAGDELQRVHAASRRSVR